MCGFCSSWCCSDSKMCANFWVYAFNLVWKFWWGVLGWRLWLQLAIQKTIQKRRGAPQGILRFIYSKVHSQKFILKNMINFWETVSQVGHFQWMDMARTGSASMIRWMERHAINAGKAVLLISRWMGFLLLFFLFFSLYKL